MLCASYPLSTVIITAATYFLLRYPETLSQLTQEIRSKFDSEQDILVISTGEMPYVSRKLSSWKPCGFTILTPLIPNRVPSDPQVSVSTTTGFLEE